MIKIIEKSGIPCIILSNGIIIPKEKLKLESIDYTIKSFTDIQHSKESISYNDIIKELKKKLNNESWDI